MSTATLEPEDRTAFMRAYGEVRARSEQICAPLEPEDTVIQAMADVSPPKWHLAHVTWFFETFVLQAFDPSYSVFDEQYGFLWNSYYEAAGPRHARPNRGHLARPAWRSVLDYRRHVDSAVAQLADRLSGPAWQEAACRITLGLHHEQQHQELLLTDILYNFAANPLLPTYASNGPAVTTHAAEPLGWIDHPGGVVSIGHAGSGFAYDNESPRHRVFLEPFRIASRLVTQGEYLAFIEDGGYRRPELWLSDGWSWVQEHRIERPLHWVRDARGDVFTLHGVRPIEPAAPVAHVSGYEAEAYAAWAGRRLPTEAEWEAVFGDTSPRALHGHRVPRPAAADSAQAFGEAWQWTRSAYAPYPGFRPLEGALGEYNGKFMCNQWVLRGSSCATSPGHARSTYRNFFYPHQRWQFTGVRLAADV